MKVYVFSEKRLRHVYAEFAESFHNNLPLQIFLGDLGPAASTDWSFLSVVKDVNFNTRVLTFLVPRISTTLHQRAPPVANHWQNVQHLLLKSLCETTLLHCTERYVKMKAYQPLILTFVTGVVVSSKVLFQIVLAQLI